MKSAFAIHQNLGNVISEIVFCPTFTIFLLFRNYLEDEETSINQLEQKLDKVLKQCGLMIDTGKSYVAHQR